MDMLKVSLQEGPNSRMVVNHETSAGGKKRTMSNGGEHSRDDERGLALGGQSTPLNQTQQNEETNAEIENNKAVDSFETMLQFQTNLTSWQAYLLQMFQVGAGTKSAWGWLTAWWTSHGTVPLKSEDEVRNEKLRLSESEQKQIMDDVFGCNGAVHDPDLEDQLAALLLLRSSIDAIPPKEKVELVEASSQCEDFAHYEILFLQSVYFDAKVAAEKMLLYWKLRVCDLGVERAFLPFTIQNAFTKEQVQTLNFGFLRILPSTDLFGRSIVIVEPGRFHGKTYDANVLNQSVLYVCHAALHRPNIGESGVVIIFYLKTAIQKYNNMNVAYHLMKTLDCFPFRTKAIHFCGFCNIVQRKFLVPGAMYYLRPHLRHRLVVHEEEGEKLLKQLQHFGMPPERLPTELGGTIELDHEKWVQERIADGL